MKKLHNLYNDEFYKNQISGSYESAQAYASILSKIISLDSVVDIGCGRGTWLKAFKEQGSSKTIGFDGYWNSQDKMLEKQIILKTCDLNIKIQNDEFVRYDLAISLEVAEHLKPESAANIIDSLVNFSDVVLFGAAYTEQGGTNHINEQPCSYWANLFIERNYVPFDVFRPKLWGNEKIEFWYKQNTFLYVLKDSHAYKKLLLNNENPISNIEY